MFELEIKTGVIRKISTAFAEVVCPFEEASFSHDELIQARKELSLMNDAAFRYVLPKILIDLIMSHPNDLEDLDRLLDYINVPSSIPENEVIGITKFLGQDIAKLLTSDEDKIIQHKASSFSLFTREQIHALLEWLKLVATWAEARDSQDDIQSAVQYWEDSLKTYPHN